MKAFYPSSYVCHAYVLHVFLFCCHLILHFHFDSGFCNIKSYQLESNLICCDMVYQMGWNKNISSAPCNLKNTIRILVCRVTREIDSRLNTRKFTQRVSFQYFVVLVRCRRILSNYFIFRCLKRFYFTRGLWRINFFYANYNNMWSLGMFYEFSWYNDYWYSYYYILLSINITIIYCEGHG